MLIITRKLVVSVSAAFAPYRVRPFEFAPTLYRVRPHTFRVRPPPSRVRPQIESCLN